MGLGPQMEAVVAVAHGGAHGSGGGHGVQQGKDASLLWQPRPGVSVPWAEERVSVEWAWQALQAQSWRKDRQARSSGRGPRLAGDLRFESAEKASTDAGSRGAGSRGLDTDRRRNEGFKPCWSNGSRSVCVCPCVSGLWHKTR